MSAVNFASLSVVAIRRTPSSALYVCVPVLRPALVLLSVFPLAGPLSSTISAACCPALFNGFAGPTGPSVSPWSCIFGLRPWTSRSDPPLHRLRRMTMGYPGSRAWRFHACTGSSTAQGPLRARDIAPYVMLPSACQNDVGTLVSVISQLNSPACMYPRSEEHTSELQSLR